MPRITQLKLLNGETRGTWTHARDTIENAENLWVDVRRVIADWADCPLSRVGTIEDDFGGELIAVDDEPVAFLVTVRTPVVDLRPILARA